MHYRSESGASADSRSNFVQLIETESEPASGGNVTLNLVLWSLSMFDLYGCRRHCSSSSHSGSSCR